MLARHWEGWGEDVKRALCVIPLKHVIDEPFRTGHEALISPIICFNTITHNPHQPTPRLALTIGFTQQVLSSLDVIFGQTWDGAVTEGRVSRGDDQVSFAPSNCRDIALSHPREYQTQHFPRFTNEKFEHRS